MQLKKITNSLSAQIVIGGASLWLMYKTYMHLIGDKKAEEAKRRASEEAKKLAQFNFENKTTYSPAQAKEFVASLAELLQYGLAKQNIPELETILMRMNNNADVKALFDLYGTKMTYLFGAPTGQKTLMQALAIEPAENKNKININWKQKGIKYKI